MFSGDDVRDAFYRGRSLFDHKIDIDRRDDQTDQTDSDVFKDDLVHVYMALRECQSHAEKYKQDDVSEYGAEDGEDHLFAE